MIDKGQHDLRDMPTLAGCTFVFTGRLRSMTRAEAHEEVRALDGQIASWISRKTTYVVAGQRPGAKLDYARQYGVVILNEADFLYLLGVPEADLPTGS
ncbi:MAG: BRCT domain-containing protein [Anaerolineaceae bacterium]|nr:BRCT domain-containing protein [Anaerolineaceae bacterium]